MQLRPRSASLRCPQGACAAPTRTSTRRTRTAASTTSSRSRSTRPRISTRSRPLMAEAMTEKASWGFTEGEEVAPGRYVWKKLGGGKTYEAYLGWDDHLAFTVVLKMVRPDRTEDGKALRALGREAEALKKLDHPLIIRGFD